MLNFYRVKRYDLYLKNMGLGFPNLNRRLNVNPRSIAAVDFAKSIATSDDRYLWTRHDRRL